MGLGMGGGGGGSTKETGKDSGERVGGMTVTNGEDGREERKGEG